MRKDKYTPYPYLFSPTDLATTLPNSLVLSSLSLAAWALAARKQVPGAGREAARKQPPARACKGQTRGPGSGGTRGRCGRRLWAHGAWQRASSILLLEIKL